ncbi:putative alpha/beta hydrolase [Aureobasidium subglaciale]|nr:putative alpha/beta hydrolase [Aureobasidium subglaciale]
MRNVEKEDQRLKASTSTLDAGTGSLNHKWVVRAIKVKRASPTQPQDIQLFTTQILLVLSSSALNWTGNKTRFALIGYSLGGGIAASFTSFFPNLVESLVLIAPAGLMRSARIHWTSKFLYGGFLPRRLVEYLVWRRLGGTSTISASNDEDGKISPTQAAEEEQSSHPALAPDSTASVLARRPSATISSIVSWQLANHAGFVPAFVSSIQHAPISNQHDAWKAIADIQHLPPSQRLLEAQVLLLLGKDDNVVLAEEMEQDAKKAMGDVVHIRILDGGHEVPVTDAAIVATTIFHFWNQQSRE